MTMQMPFTRAPRAGVRARSDVRGSGPTTRRGFQIGPRIRVGGTLGKIGQNVKVAAGKALSNPIVDAGLTFIPGVGPGIAAAAGAAGRALDTSNGGLHGVGGLGSLAAGAAEGYGAGKLATGLTSGIGSIINGGGLNADGSPMGVLDRLKGLVTSGGAGVTGAISGGLNGLKGLLSGGGTPGASGGNSLLDSLLLGGSVASAAADKAKQQGLIDKSTQYATNAYDEKAPLRTKALAGLQNTTAPDLSSLFSNSGNVYSRQREGLPPLTTHPSAASLTTGGDALSSALAARVKAPAPTSVPSPAAPMLPPGAPTNPANPMSQFANSYS